MSSSTYTSTQTSQDERLTIHLRGSDEQALIEEHSAHRQAETNRAGRRADREYREAYQGDNPEGWPETRGCPPYRPLETNMDVSRRPWAGNPGDVVFVRTMLTGVFVMGLANSAWRSTVGRVTDKVWRYPIGGQY